jgi:hypothetical protein
MNLFLVYSRREDLRFSGAVSHLIHEGGIAVQYDGKEKGVA